MARRDCGREGRLSDTAHRRLCITIRPRGGGGCHRFDLDTIRVGDRAQRCLIVYAYPMDRPHHTPMDHLLLERIKGMRGRREFFNMGE